MTALAEAIETSARTKTLVKLSFRQIVDSTSQTEFEKKVWEDSYDEFLIQTQSFDREGKCKTWHELVAQFPKAKINVTYKTGFAIGLFVKSLNNIVPHIKDNLDSIVIPFTGWTFEIIDSDIRSRQQHRVAITYETDEVELKEIIGDFMVVAFPGFDSHTTITIRMFPGISISSHRSVSLAAQ